MDAVTVVREGRGNDIGRARLFCALARANGLPCRVVVGLPLEQRARQDQLPLLERGLPRRRLGAVRRRRAPRRRAAARPPVARRPTPTARRSSPPAPAPSPIRFDVQSELETYAELVQRRAQPPRSTPLDRISLLFLPVQLQHTLRILLLVPLGALAMCVLRNIVGLQHLRHVHADADRPRLHRHRALSGARSSSPSSSASPCSRRIADPAPLPAARGAHRFHPDARHPADDRAVRHRRPRRHAERRRRRVPLRHHDDDRRAHQRQPRGGRRRQHAAPHRRHAGCRSTHLRGDPRPRGLQTFFLVFPELPARHPRSAGCRRPLHRLSSHRVDPLSRASQSERRFAANHANVPPTVGARDPTRRERRRF